MMRKVSIGIASFFLCFAPLFSKVFSDTSLSITVTPPLFQLTISPGQTWKSALKIVNSNPYEVTYYAQPMDFSAEGEGGQATFAPVVNIPHDGTADTYSLARWIQISPEPVVVAAGRSAEVPFTVHIPLDAEPGGHYGAILVGTQPRQTKINGPAMKISSYVSSLLFVRVEGNIEERARMREFRTDRSLYQEPQANFVVRFENLGNTHLKPEGVITIYNMWGKKRGELFVNQEKNFGNVLPKTVRKFSFNWAGDASVFDIGQYRAVVTMNFGDNSKQNISATTYFWVVPVVPVVVTLTITAIFMLLLIWFIRRYIRRALALEARATARPPFQVRQAPETPLVQMKETYTLHTLVEPLREGVIDMRRISSIAKPTRDQHVSIAQTTDLPQGEPQVSSISLLEFLQEYQTFFIFIVVLIGAGIAAYLFFARVLIPEGSYKINNVLSQVEVIPAH